MLLMSEVRGKSRLDGGHRKVCVRACAPSYMQEQTHQAFSQVLSKVHLINWPVSVNVTKYRKKQKNTRLLLSLLVSMYNL